MSASEIRARLRREFARPIIEKNGDVETEVRHRTLEDVVEVLLRREHANADGALRF